MLRLPKDDIGRARRLYEIGLGSLMGVDSAQPAGTLRPRRAAGRISSALTVNELSDARIQEVGAAPGRGGRRREHPGRRSISTVSSMPKRWLRIQDSSSRHGQRDQRAHMTQGSRRTGPGRPGELRHQPSGRSAAGRTGAGRARRPSQPR